MRFSKLMLSICALITMNGCAYVIPPEQNAPRHNTVLGAQRRPQLNFNTGPQSSIPRAPDAANFSAAAPVDPVIVASQQAPQTSGDATPEPQFQQITAAPVAPVARADSLRAIPAENQQFQVAGTFPAIDSVPPRPSLTGSDSSQSRLNATQADLERARAQAQQSSETLARDAAAEPSLLAPMPAQQNLAPVTPAPTLPANDRRTPIGNGAAAPQVIIPAPVASALPAPRIVLPSVPVVTQFSVPTGPSFAPPTPLNVASLNVPQSQPVRTVPAEQPQAVSAVQTSAPVVTNIGQRQPIVLRAPVPYEAAPASVAVTPAPARGGITVRPGDFDPLAGA